MNSDLTPQAFNSFPDTVNSELRGPEKMTREEYWARVLPPEQLKNRDLIFKLQDALLSLPQEWVKSQMKPVHRFINGVYMRELTMPPGFVIVGRTHAQEHFVVMTEGRCSVFTEHGREEMEAPYTFISPAGEKRALFIHEKTTWLTIHKTDQTDPDECQNELTFLEPFEYQARLEQNTQEVLT